MERCAPLMKMAPLWPWEARQISIGKSASGT